MSSQVRQVWESIKFSHHTSNAKHAHTKTPYDNMLHHHAGKLFIHDINNNSVVINDIAVGGEYVIRQNMAYLLVVYLQSLS